MALLPPHLLDMVVAIGKPTNGESINYVATGFLYGEEIPETRVGDLANHWLFLVTNRHVVEDSPNLVARLNYSVGQGSRLYDLRLNEAGGPTPWSFHPNPVCDVAVASIELPQLHADGIEYEYFPKSLTLSLDRAKDIQVSEGDGVFVLGYPMGIAGEERNYPIARQGSIARIRDWLEGHSQTLLIDAPVFPGNSGGPVILKPEMFSVADTKSNSLAYLIGMVSSYLPYKDVAVSPQTGRPRVIFEENSGLARIVPANIIHETVAVAVQRLMAISG